MYNNRWPLVCGAAAAVLSIVVSGSRPANAGDGFTVTRANLANSATFTVTQTLAPKGSPKFVRIYKVEIKGNEARVNFSDPSAGDVCYVANKKGLFLYLPGSKTAMKQPIQGGIEGALKQAFAQASGKLPGAVKVGSAVVSGQPTDIYKDPKTGAVIYLGKKPGFRLPVKTEQTNVGGSTSLLVTDIHLNVAVPESRFALPAGTRIVDSSDSSGALPAALPGGGAAR